MDGVQGRVVVVRECEAKVIWKWYELVDLMNIDVLMVVVAVARGWKL